MTREVKSFMAGSAAFFLFAMMRNVIPLHNMEFFVSACVVFALVTLAVYFLTGRYEKGLNRRWEKAGSILAIVCLAGWMAAFYVNETDAVDPLEETELIRRYFPFPVWITLMTVGVLLCLFILRKNYGGKFMRAGKRIRVLAALLFTAGTSVQFYAPNVFREVQGGLYHSHAYTNSIINACWLIPYSKDMQSLYGHYGILYMPLLKFLHRCFHINYLTGISIVTAVLAGISILVYLYLLNYFAKSDLIFYLGMFAIGEQYFMLMQGGVYLQVHPHRMIFPVILAALALQEYKKGKNYNIAAVTLITLSFIWSTEVGIVTMLSFGLYRWVQQIMDGKGLSVRKILLLFRMLALYAIVPGVLAYIVINGYNLLAKGPVLNMREFLFPLISDRDYIENIELPLPDASHAWAGTAVLLLGAVSPALLQVIFPKEEEKGKKPFFFLLGVMSLGLMLYYINRPAEGCMFITLFLMLTLQAALLQKCQDSYLEWKEKKEPVFQKDNRFLLLSLRIITTAILFIMAFDCVYSMPKAWKTSAETIWKMDDLEEFAQYVYVQVPPDAVAFGQGVPELLSLIDRDTHLHTTEWSYLNMPLDTMEKVRNLLEDQEWFFCSLSSLWYMQNYYPDVTDHFYLHEEFQYNGIQFGFFRKNNEV